MDFYFNANIINFLNSDIVFILLHLMITTRISAYLPFNDIYTEYLIQHVLIIEHAIRLSNLANS